MSDLEKYHELTTAGIWLLSVGVKDVNCDVAEIGINEIPKNSETKVMKKKMKKLF